MKFYHVDNRGKGRNVKSHYIIAKDKVDAKRIASTQAGEPSSIVEMTPEKNIQKLLDDGKTGLLCYKMNMTSLSDIFSNVETPQPEEPWELYEEI